MEYILFFTSEMYLWVSNFEIKFLMKPSLSKNGLLMSILLARAALKMFNNASRKSCVVYVLFFL